MRKLAIIVAAAAVLTGITAGAAQANRDTNWPCAGCLHHVGR
jgi:Spy/CpxP family protein refolding chaperone